MKKLIFLLALIVVATVSFGVDRTGAIRQGFTTLSTPLVLTTADDIDASETVTYLITNSQPYLQHQTFTATLDNITGTTDVAVTAYGKVNSGDNYVQIGDPVTLSADGTATITSATPKNYNFLKVTFVAGAGAQHSHITAFAVKTANVASLTSAGIATFTGGLAASGGAVNVNASSNNVTNIGTGTTNAAIAIGGGSNTLAINTSDWDITTAGVMTGIGNITTDGVITMQNGEVIANTTDGSFTLPNLIRKHTPVAVNATATTSAANMLAGVISSTSAAATNITTPTATAIAALIPGCGMGTAFDLIIDNSAGASTVTLVLDGSITIVNPAIITGGATLTLATGTTGKFSFYFVSGTAARCFRVY